ncbi:MAG: glycosyltransferase family 2 protein, partial [Bacteroidaceae bacterium]|nr:glycosyltransferase family 2 protein [Bacteroidaceae bacterium]
MNPMDDLKKTMSERGICVVIPTYNNGGTIAAVVEATLEQCDDVIVVNDGSTDATGDILRAMTGITLVDYSRNRGKGYALKRGFAKALEMGFAYAVTLDADGQHYPKEIARLVEANIEHPGALIVGSRDLSGIDASG